MALPQKYRPLTLDEVKGNEVTIKSLKTILRRDEKDRQHAILFTGPSGCGKTTLARIMAKELGCNGRDYVEIDAVQFRGIDTIKEIRNCMAYNPSEGTKRGWLLDECHKLTNDAQNCLLKALEDAPEHVHFFLATTEPEKLIDTIRTRCSTFVVEPLDEDTMTDLLRDVTRSEKVRIPPEVIKVIVRDSFGSSREALQILDKIIGLEPEEMIKGAEKVSAQLNQSIELCRALMAREKWTTIAKILKGLEKEDAESIRLAVRGYARVIGYGADDPSLVFLILDSFKDPIYSSHKDGHAQLMHAATLCYTS